MGERRAAPGSATDLLAALDSGALTAVDAVDAAIGALTRDAAGVRAVIRVASDARREAAEVDRRRSAGEALPLDGLPITVKDSFDVAGMVSGHGIRADEHVATADAPAVAALRAAGCVVVGKTNVPTLLADYQSVSPEHPHTRNPWDTTRTSGGSSSGAAAVAAGQAYLDLGSDMVGSVRVPAAWCGTYALRPSHGLISKRGHLPWPTDLRLEPPASTVGLMTRSARDLAVPFEALLAGAPGGGACRPLVPVTAPLRLGVWVPDTWPATGRAVRAAIEAWCTRLAEAGVVVVRVTPPRAGRAEAEVYDHLTAAEIAHGRTDRGPRFPLLDALESQAAVTAAWRDELFADVDALVCPVAPVTAPPLSDVPLADRTVDVDGTAVPASTVLDWSVVTSVARCPAVVVPVGTSAEDGLPVGVQILTDHGSDRRAIAIAVALEEGGLVGFVPPPSPPTKENP
jgi:amidase